MLLGAGLLGAVVSHQAVEAVVAGLAGADCHHHAFHGLFLGGIGNDDPPFFGFLRFLVHGFHEHPITDRPDSKCHKFIYLC